MIPIGTITVMKIGVEALITTKVAKTYWRIGLQYISNRK
jgi:hypothetical protein